MTKRNLNWTAFGLLAGLAIWILGAIAIYFEFYKGIVWDKLNTIPKFTFLFHSGLLMVFLFLGVLVWQTYVRHNAMAKALEHSDRRFKFLFNTIGDGVWITNERGSECLYVNPAAKNLFSFSSATANMKIFKDKVDFSDTYPFVPYQFNLLQKVFEKIRQI